MRNLNGSDGKIPSFVRKRSKDIRNNRNAKAAGFIGSSNDSLDQDQSDQKMDNNNIVYNQQAAIRYQIHDASVVAPEASSALQCILSPQMSKRLAHIAPPMPLYKMQHQRHHSMSDSDAGPNFGQPGSAQEIYQQQQPLYLPHHPSMYPCQHDLAPSQAYYCPSTSNQAIYPGGHGYHHPFVQQQQLMQHPSPQRPISAYTETTSFYSQQHQYPPPYPPPSIPYSVIPPPPQALYSSGPIIYPRHPSQTQPQVYSQQELASIHQVQTQYSPRVYAADPSMAQHSPRRFSAAAPVQHRSADGFAFNSQMASDFYNKECKRETPQQQIQNFRPRNNATLSFASEAFQGNEIVSQVTTLQHAVPTSSGDIENLSNALACDSIKIDDKNVESGDQKKLDGGLLESQESDELSSESPRHLASAGNRYHCGAKMELEHGRTPLFGQCPVWWGENGKKPEDVDVLSPTVPPPHHSSANEERLKPEVASKTNDSPKLRRDNIRMDIPFNVPCDTRKEIEKTDKRRSGPGALAFTIDFTSTDAALKKRNSTGKADHKAETEWKLQSAERLKQNFLRRSIRKGSTDLDVTKSALPNKVQAPVAASSTIKESKKLLMDKMFNNYTTSSGSPKIVKSSKKIAPGVSSADEKPKRTESCADNESDAGTFVIERDQEEMNARMKIDKVFGISESYACWSSSEESLNDHNESKNDAVIKPRSRTTKQFDVPTFIMKTQAPRLTVPLTPRKKSPSSEIGTNTTPQDSTSFRRVTNAVFDIGSSNDSSAKKGLIKELAKINKASSTQQSATPVLNKATTPRTTKKFVSPPQPPPAKPSGRSTSFGRNEAGRYSLRAWPSPNNSNTAVNLTGLSSAASQRQKSVHAPQSITTKKATASNAPQKSAELNLWLRRKEYNPMKAAAMARAQKPNNPKVDDPPYLSNRSQSFHTGAAALSKLSVKRHHQSIENKIDDIIGDQESERLDIDSDSITCKYTIRFSNDPPTPTPSRSRNSDRHSTNSMQNISKLTAELGTHAEQLLNKLNLDQEETSNGNRSDRLSSNSPVATLGQQNSQLEDLVRRLELANRAFEVVDKYLKDQSEKGTNNVEPSDPVSSSSPKNEEHIDGNDSERDIGVHRVPKTKL